MALSGGIQSGQFSRLWAWFTDVRNVIDLVAILPFFIEKLAGWFTSAENDCF